MHTPAGVIVPTVPAVLASVLPSRNTLMSATAPSLPGLESVESHDSDSSWLHDCLLGPHSADIVPYLTLARSTGGPVLDLGSGAGRLAVPFARHGFSVEAVDRDQRSLTALRAWADRLQPRMSGSVDTIRADLAGMRLRRNYQLALLSGAMISAVHPGERLRMLREIAGHLGAGGALVLDYTAHDPHELAEHPERTWLFQVPRFDGVQECVVARQVFDLPTMGERITYYSERTAKAVAHRVVLTTEKWIVDPSLLAEELSAAGLRITERRQQRIDRRTQSILLICAA